MKITRIGFMLYEVVGETDTYQVCLESNKFKGHCSCGHHCCVVQPAYNEGREIDACKHIPPTKAFAWDEIAPSMAAIWSETHERTI